MSQAHKGGFKPSGNDPFPIDFFKALDKGDDTEALACLRAEALPAGVGGEPSPLARELIKTGEWDSNQKLSLIFVDANACTGRVGNDDFRFCGKPTNFCGIAAHTKTTVGKIERGWYISLGKAHGIATTPHLPAIEDGGPISTVLGTRLLEQAFKLTRGQWRFVIDSWHALKADDISVSETSSRKSVEVTLKLPPKTKPESEDVIYQEEESGGGGGFALSEFDLLYLRLDDSPMKAILLLMKNENDRLSREVTVLSSQLERSEIWTQRLRESNAALQEDARRNMTRAQALEASRGEQQQRFQVLTDRIETIEDAVNRVSNGEGAQLPPGLYDKVEELDVAMFGPSGAFARFKDSFLEFKEKQESGGGLECNGVTFTSQRHFINWFTAEKPTLDIFLDGVAFLHGISAPVVHSDDALKQLELQMKTDINTGLEASVITSFSTIIPSILVGGGGRKGEYTAGGTNAWLAGYLKNFEVWKPIGSVHGVSHQITTGVPTVAKQVVELRKQFDNSDVLKLSLGLCTDSCSFCTELVTFINGQQEELTTNTSYTAEQVWRMQLDCLQKIFEELNAARVGYSQSGRLSRGNLIWGMLQAWKVQERYRKNNFKDDPALTGILVRRILMQGQDNSVKKQLQKIDANEAKIDNQKRENNAAVKLLKDEIAKIKDELKAKK